MTSEGKLIVCDRCNASVFCPRAKEEELYGGYERHWTYEESPGWAVQYGRNLCPVCNEEFMQLKAKFFGEDDV